MANEYELMKAIERLQADNNALAQNAQRQNAYLWGAHQTAVASRVNAAIEQGLEKYPLALTPGEAKGVSAMVSSALASNPQLAAKVMSGDVSDVAIIAERAAAEVKPETPGSRVGRPMIDDWDTTTEAFLKDVYRTQR